MSSPRQSRRLVCIVPFRIDSDGLRFCLSTKIGTSRWTFAKDAIRVGEQPIDAALRLAAETGLQCTAVMDQPLDVFPPSRGERADSIEAFLLRVDREVDSDDIPVRRRWCQAEEASLRIRRKPMQRLVDLAVEQLEA